MAEGKERYSAVLSASIFAFRLSMHLSQERMAELLCISTRSYIDLEHGRYCCSAMTLIMFLIHSSDEENLCLIREFRRIFSEREPIGAA